MSIIRSAEDFKDLDESIVRNFDVILLTTMNIIYKVHGSLKESPFGDASRQQVSVGQPSQVSACLLTTGGIAENDGAASEGTVADDVCRNGAFVIDASFTPRIKLTVVTVTAALPTHERNLFSIDQTRRLYPLNTKLATYD